MKRPQSLVNYRIKRRLFLWVGCECSREAIGFGEERLAAELRNCECDPCVKKARWADHFTRETLLVLRRRSVNAVLVRVGRRVGGMPRATTSYRPTAETRTYTYASRDTVLACQPKVIECFSTVWTWKCGWKYCREQSAWRYTRKNLGASFFRLATLSGTLAPEG
jgi:hypothetical protein